MCIVIKTELFPHQVKCRDFILNNGGCGALYLDIGVGKTLTSLSIYSKLLEKQPSLKLLVLCPLSILENAWANDILKHTTYTYTNLRKSTDQAHIYLGNYEMVLRDGLSRIIKQTNPSMIVLDESVRIKSHDAKTTKELLKHSSQFKYRIILSGCPAPNDMTEYWSQMMFVNQGIFPRSFYAFRNQFFHLQRGNQTIPAGAFITRDKYKEIFGKGFKYNITEEKKERLIKQMQPHAIWIKSADCLKLPEEIDVIRDVTLNEPERRSYNDMAKHLVAVINQEMVAATTALTKLIKLREMTSGFVIDSDGKTHQYGKSKLAELENVIEEIGQKQAIIWVNFHHEISQILSVLGVDKCAQIHGLIDNKDEEIASFKDGRKQFLIANPASASSGLNLQNAHIQIFYSLSYSYDEYYQCRGRTRRVGQKDNCIYIHLIAKGTIDEIILDVIRKKGDAQEIVYRFLRK